MGSLTSSLNFYFEGASAMIGIRKSCTFCKKFKEEVENLFEQTPETTKGDGETRICNECVMKFKEVLDTSLSPLEPEPQSA